MRENASSYDPQGPAVIVDPYSSGAQLAPAFTSRGITPVAVLTAHQPPAVYAGSYRPQDFDHILVDDAGIDALVTRLRTLRPRCILAGCESGVELAEKLAPLVVAEVANVAELAAARRHKGAMAEAVAAGGLRVIPQVCAISREEVRRWIQRAGVQHCDLVVKPPKSASTDGVTFVSGGRGWEEVFDTALNSTNRLGIVNDSVLVQQYVRGIEYVVDTFSHDGRHTVTDVCRYTKVSNDGHMAVYDAMEWIDPSDPVVKELVDYTHGVLDAVGIRFGAAHVEVMHTDTGPVLIEVGARPHGGGQPRFCMMATGDSQIQRTVRYLDGDHDIPTSYELVSPTLIVFHIVPGPSRVAAGDGLARIRELPNHRESSFNATPGDCLEATLDLFGSLAVGFVVLSGRDREALWKDYAAIRSIEAEMFLPWLPAEADKPGQPTAAPL